MDSKNHKKGKSKSLIIVVAIVAVALLAWLGYTQAQNFVAAKISGDNKGQVELRSHKAIYDLELHSVTSGTKLINLDGQMYFSWEKQCAGWASDHRFNLLYEYADTPGVRVTSDFSTFEDEDNSKFSFSSVRKKDGVAYEDIKGHADKSEDGATAFFKSPEGLEIDLGADILFPSEHTRMMLENARQGKKFFTATVFDGSDAKGPSVINGFISDANALSRPREVSFELADRISGSPLLSVKSYLIRLAFFPIAQDNAEPEYEMTVRLYENGVISEMFIEYNDFSVIQKLTALEEIQEQNCGSENE